MSISLCGYKHLSPDTIYLISLENKKLDDIFFDVCKHIFPEAQIIIHSIKMPTKGSVCSAYLLSDMIDPESKILVTALDQVFDSSLDLSTFNKSSFVCPIISQQENNDYSYLIRDDEGNPIQVYEDQCISEEALAGIYYFKRADIFYEYFEKLMLKFKGFRGRNFYMSDLINEMILDKNDLIFPDISKKKLEKFKDLQKFYEKNRS